MITEEQKLELFVDAVDILLAMAERGNRQLILDEKEFLEHGNIRMNEQDIPRIPVSKLVPTWRGKLIQEATFLERLFSKGKWKERGWKVELVEGGILCWPDMIEGGKERCGIHISLDLRPKI